MATRSTRLGSQAVFCIRALLFLIAVTLAAPTVHAQQATPSVHEYPDDTNAIAASISKSGLARLSLSVPDNTAPLSFALQPFVDSEGTPTVVNFRNSADRRRRLCIG